MSFTQEQIDDFAELLAHRVGVGEILSLGRTFAGEDAMAAAAAHVNDRAALARAVVAELVKADQLSSAFASVRSDAPPHSLTDWALRSILRGERIHEGALQAFRDEPDPFFETLESSRRHWRVARTVCAIGLGGGINELRGSGFLVAPNLVLTACHVIEPFVAFENGTFRPDVAGDQITCFFDYYAFPEPRLPYRRRRRDAFEAVSAAPVDWLVHASSRLPDEGEPSCPKEADGRFDYALIRLSRMLGKWPWRSGGGPLRGWLEFPESVDYQRERRMFLYQHPAGYPQTWDLGNYKQRDVTRTRAQYTMNTARGSSGAPAVSGDGELFAMHTAAVRTDPSGLNQGVCVDLIANDLNARVPGWKPAGKLGEDSFWSLSDDLLHSEPIIGRDAFREHVDALQYGKGPRVLVVYGPPGCGLRYSVKLLKRQLGVLVPVAEVSADALSRFSPAGLLQTLLVGLNVPASEPPPEPNPHEDLPRWLRITLPRWLRTQLEAAEKQDRTRFPAWIVLHTTAPPGERFVWADQLYDLVAALAGAHDAGQTTVGIPQLRFLFLASSPEGAVLPGVERLEEDLRTYDSWRQDFAACVQNAWRSIDPEESAGAPEVLEKLAELVAGDTDDMNRRRILRDSVRELVLRRLARGSA